MTPRGILCPWRYQKDGIHKQTWQLLVRGPAGFDRTCGIKSGWTVPLRWLGSAAWSVFPPQHPYMSSEQMQLFFDGFRHKEHWEHSRHKIRQLYLRTYLPILWCTVQKYKELWIRCNFFRIWIWNEHFIPTSGEILTFPSGFGIWIGICQPVKS